MMMMMMMMMIWGSLRANVTFYWWWPWVLDHFAQITHSVHMAHEVHKIDTYRSMNCKIFVSFFQENRLAFEFEGVKNDFFPKKTKKKVFFPLLVSDHVVTQTCITVRAHFFDFPIDFFWGLSPSLYADEVLCAAFRAARTPPYSIRVAQTSKMAKPYTSACNVFLCNRSAKVELWCKRELNFHDFYNSR